MEEAGFIKGEGVRGEGIEETIDFVSFLLFFFTKLFFFS